MPIIVGFRAKTPGPSREIAGIADGTVVGSAVVQKIADAKTHRQNSCFCEVPREPCARGLGGWG
ncbi:hypothetical protein [Nereida sp. MMG025]|uniref:hypothetical protein n=1 Tax=Nereida sp. MMG025 TaxID=2909981 RepID=UPI00351D775E